MSFAQWMSAEQWEQLKRDGHIEMAHPSTAWDGGDEVTTPNKAQLEREEKQRDLLKLREKIRTLQRQLELTDRAICDGWSWSSYLFALEHPEVDW